MTTNHHSQQLTTALAALELPPNVQIRCWEEDDFAAIQHLSKIEDWPTPIRRAAEALIAWQHSWPALVITDHTEVVGFVRGLTDGEVTTYIAELLVAAQHRSKGYGRLLLEACHLLYPHTRLDLAATEGAIPFYKRHGFRDVGPGLRKSYR
ncbi:MAG TPA: GNAT family N-acetyltransferase [Ktedonobacteraceae bacterium]|jgi:ribosomal protein S18 acetylase RimI-like enzyme|nr:GNAT family N-acetyltransferase [Ktedonobacteraceae bacterium]